MAANPVSDFDLGPLTWVKTEIDHSLNQARENLDKLAANPGDRAPAKYILTHLHQATGALAMVGLAAATRFNEELEKLVAFLEPEEAVRLPAAVAAAKRGISALSAYLDTLLGGQPDHPMRLLAPYLELNRARGQNDANEGDLFYPNLSATLPALPAAAALDDAVLAKALALQRSQYQQGLLRMLKGGDTSEAMRNMHAAVTAIESLQATTPNRPFWSAAAAFFDALVFGGADVGPAAKPLFAKLDQQIKQLIDGSGKVAERVFRDLLLAVGRARSVSERITMLKEAYRLEQLLEIPDRGVRAADDEALGALVRELRDLTAQQKDAWLKYTSGNRAALEPFGKQALVLAERAGKLPNRDIQLVLVRLSEVTPQLKAKAIPPSESQSLEVATALLFTESALENFVRLGADFPRQARTVTERLKAAMAGEPLPPVDAIEGGLLDEMTRRAQEKLLIFQVGQEVQVNLQNIEQVLDGFFRDNAKRDDLKGLAAQFAQVQGALMILELVRRRRAQRRGDGARAAVRRRLARRQAARRPRWSPTAFPRSASTSRRCSKARPRRATCSFPRCCASGWPSRTGRGGGSAAHRHRVPARHRRAEAEGPGALRGLEGEARRGNARDAREGRGRIAARRRRRFRFRGRAQERGGAPGPQGSRLVRTYRHLPRDPGPRAARRRPRRPPRRWSSSSTRPAPRSTRSCSTSSSRKPARSSRRSPRTSRHAARRRTIARRSPRSAAASIRSRAAAGWWASPTWARWPGSASR